MNLESVIETMNALLTITAINGIVVCTITFAFLCIRDKMAHRKRIMMRSRDIEKKK